MKIYKKHEMKEHSNMKVGGIARNYFIAESKEEIKDIVENYSNIFIIGNGILLLHLYMIKKLLTLLSIQLITI